MSRHLSHDPFEPRHYDLKDADLDSPIVKLTNLILAEGLSSQASAIRIAALATGCPVHFLIDGQWRQVMQIPSAAGRPVMNRLRVMANLDPTTTPRPHSGEIHVAMEGRTILLNAQVHATSDGSQELTIHRSETAA
jgi:type II secretory ATPase GspE/PulE/Tfp pilus assembly ATPase PilB-like protein